MVPYADYMNHENVDTSFDCQDDEGKSLGISTCDKTAEEKERERKSSQRKRDFLNSMNTDLLELETTLRNKMEDEGHITQSMEEKESKAVSL